MPLRSILCSVDFSEHSRHALRWAVEFASRYERLIVVTVIDRLLADAARMHFGQDLKAESETALRDFMAATVAGDGTPPLQVRVDVRIGEPAAGILDAAGDEGAGLIVMGTQGLGGLRKWLLGSTTQRVLRRTSMPVLAVPPGSSAPGVARIVAATDFSDSSIAAIKTAAKLAGDFSAALSLVHVIEPVVVPAEWREVAEHSDESRAVGARGTLQELADRSCGTGGCDTIVSVGRPAEQIAAVAQEHHADLIVMGLSGEQGPLAPRPGSIAYRVLCSTTVPVLVVPGS